MFLGGRENQPRLIPSTDRDKVVVRPDMKDGNRREGKSPRAPVPISPPGELTCSEGQVEDLLSKGESTEEENISLQKQTAQKPPLSRNTPQVITPGRKRK
jgi:hypothetical protein